MNTEAMAEREQRVKNVMDYILHKAEPNEEKQIQAELELFWDLKVAGRVSSAEEFLRLRAEGKV